MNSDTRGLLQYKESFLQPLHVSFTGVAVEQQNDITVMVVALQANGRDPADTGRVQASHGMTDGGLQHYFHIIYSATVGSVRGARARASSSCHPL